MKAPQIIFLVIIVAVMIGVLVMGFSFYKVRKKSMADRFALEKISETLLQIVNQNLKKWDAGISGGTTELQGKDGKRGHQLIMQIHVSKEFKAEVQSEIEKILAADEREGWMIKLTAYPEDDNIVFNLNIYTVPVAK